MNLILSLILSIAALFASLFGGTAPADGGDGEPAGTVAAAFAETSDEGDSSADGSLADAARDDYHRTPYLAPRPAGADIDYADIAYEHYDPETFYSDTELLVDLARRGDAEGVNALYDRLYAEFLYIDSLSVLAMLRHDTDFYDEYWTAEYTYMNSLWSETSDALVTACSQVLDTGCGNAFAEHIGEDAALQFWNYDAISPGQLEASDREMELLDEFYTLYDAIDDMSFSYEGRTWTLDDFYGFPGSALAYSDYDAYMTIYNGLNQRISETFAPLYIELVSLWTDTARDAGYDSYADFAYENVFVRDYTPEDAQRFCDAVKPIAREYYANLYYSDMSYDVDLVHPVYTGEELIGLLGEYLPRIDESLTAPWEDMTARGLWDVAPARSGRYDGSYTTAMQYYRAPCLFATMEGSCRDFITVSHEFGHFSDYFFSPPTNIFTQVDNLDLSEIHSNALQALFTAFYGEIYDEHADIAEFSNLSDLLENMLDGCLYDEFQRRVLAEADGLTPERINEIHREVCQDYGLYEPGDREWDSGWVYITHNFERPLYYISYAASAMAALQVWDIAQTDFDAAVDTYLAVLGRGAYREGYFDVLSACGLRLFTEEGAVAQVCRPVLDRLEILDREY